MTRPRGVPPVCGNDGVPLVITRDAIGRPRYRCPDCQGVNTTPVPAGLEAPLHRQHASSSRALAWPPPTAPTRAPTPRTAIGAARGQSTPAVRIH